MREVYHASFSIGRENNTPKLEEIIRVAQDWVCKRVGKLDLIKVNEELECQVEDNFVNVLNLKEKDSSFFSLILEYNDKDDSDLRWRTVFCVKDDQILPYRVSVRLFNGWKDGVLHPETNYKVMRPMLVPALIDNFDAHEVYPLKSKPLVVKENNVGEFVQKILDKNRQLPIVYISCTNFFDKPVVDANQIANMIVGLAHVYVANNRWTSFKMEELIGKSMNCYNGAVRIYWPIKDVQTEMIHPLIIPAHISGKYAMRGQLLPYELLEKIAKYSISRKAEISHEDLLQLRLRQKIGQLSDQNDFGELANLYLKENQLLKDDNLVLKESERKLLAQVQTLEVRAAHLSNVIQSMKEGGAGIEEDLTLMTEFNSVKDAIDAFKKIYSEEQVLILSRAYSEAKDLLYENPSIIFKGLEWLATTYRKMRTGKVEGNFRDSCLEQTGLHYRPRQSTVTMGKFDNEYFVLYEGQKRSLSEHLRKGVSKDPRHSLSIAFFYDKPKNLVVVGFIGRHQTTDAT